MSAGRFPNTPSNGHREVLDALLAAKATGDAGGRMVDTRHLKRHLAPRVLESDIQTVLTALQGAGQVVTDGNGRWAIATGELEEARAHPSPRYQL